jgi:hypothetical protein
LPKFFVTVQLLQENSKIELQQAILPEMKKISWIAVVISLIGNFGIALNSIAAPAQAPAQLPPLQPFNVQSAPVQPDGQDGTAQLDVTPLPNMDMQDLGPVMFPGEVVRPQQNSFNRQQEVWQQNQQLWQQNTDQRLQQQNIQQQREIQQQQNFILQGRPQRFPELGR